MRKCTLCSDSFAPWYTFNNLRCSHTTPFVQASTNLLTVNLFVLPYNYPMLLPLLDDLFKAHRLKPTNEWRTQFHNYLRTMPTYYAGDLI